MRTAIIMLSLLVLVTAAVGAVWAADAAKPWAKVEELSGSAQAKIKDGSFSALAKDAGLTEDQVLRTGKGSQVSVRFAEGDLLAVVGEDTEVALTDLLLKVKLEKMREKVQQPTNDQPAKMQVTPLAGTRATDQADDKAEDPKRDHHWEENVDKK